MNISPIQQIIDLVNKSQKFLITLPAGLNPDSLGSGLALKNFLVRLGKEAEVVSSASMPENLSFLPGSASLRHDLSFDENFVVVVDTAAKGLEEISYEAENGAAKIFLKAKKGQFSQEDVSFSADRRQYDAVFVLDCPSLENLGALLGDNSETLLSLPKVNIDHHPENEYFGAINYVDINATSVAEMLALVFEKYEESTLDEDIATNLLTGIISKTHSFQHAQTTPRAFLKASELINLGGRQQEVIKNLYKTKSLPLLRLWGRALARLKMPDGGLAVYSVLNLSDFGKAGASHEDLLSVLSELMENISGYKIVGLVSEGLGGSVKYMVALHPQIAAEKIAGALGEGVKISVLPSNYGLIESQTSSVSLAEAEQKFIEVISSIKA